MAVLHFKVGAATVTSGSGAARVVQYLTREGRYAPEQAEVDYLTRTSPETAARDDLVHQETAHLPSWAGGDARVFFHAAEQYERVNGRWGKTWQLSLPRELSREQQIDLARTFLETHLHDKPYLFVVHDPVNADGRHQPHVHVLFSERTLDGIDRGPAQHFSRFNRAHPDRGGAEKDPFFVQRNAPALLRHAWSDMGNLALEKSGHAERLHPGSLYSRGIDREPEPKLGYRSQGDATDRQQTIRDRTDRELEQVQARDAWEVRKGTLGITDVHQVTLAQVAAQGYHQARGSTPGHWQPGSLTDKERAVQRTQRQTARLTRDIRRGEIELRILTRRLEGLNHPRGREPEHHRQELAREGQRIHAKLQQLLTARRSESSGAGLRARLRDDEEQEQTRGYGR